MSGIINQEMSWKSRGRKECQNTDGKAVLEPKEKTG